MENTGYTKIIVDGKEQNITYAEAFAFREYFCDPFTPIEVLVEKHQKAFTTSSKVGLEAAINKLRHDSFR